MSFEKLYRIIDRSFIGRLVNKKLEIINKTDPNRIYIENVRSFFNIPFKVARFFCDAAVQRKLFVKKIGVLCPNEDKIILDVDSQDEIPKVIHCETCEAMEGNRYDFKKEEVRTIDYYQVVK